MKHFAITLAVLALLVGCSNAITKDSVKAMKREVKYAKQDAYSAKKSVKPLKDYIAALGKGGVKEGVYLMVTPADIKKMGTKAFIPYTFSAKELSSKFSGKFVTKKIMNVGMSHSNKLKIRLFLKGKKIGIHEKSALYKSHIPKIKAALHAGVIVDLVVNINLSPKTHGIVARVRCTKVQLKKHNKDLYRNNIKKAINSKMKNKKYRMSLGKVPGLTPAELFTTGHHVVVHYL